MISLGKSNSIICDTISSIGIGLKKITFSTNLLAKLLSDSLFSIRQFVIGQCSALDSLSSIGQFVIGQFVHSIGQFVIGQFVQYWTVCYRTVFSIGQFVIGHFDKAISLKVVV